MNFNILKMFNLKDKLVLRPTNKMTKKYQIHNSRLIILIKLVMIVTFNLNYILNMKIEITNKKY